MTELTIDPEFRDLIPPIGDDELKGLERGILLDGCLDPLKLWNGAIVDGHNRYSICQKHQVPFQTTDMHFTNRDDAKVWILRNQMGRRNLLDYQRGVVAIKLETLLKPKAKEQQRQSPGRPARTEKGLPKSAKVFEPLRTEVEAAPAIDEQTAPVHVRKEVAKAAGLSEDTIRKVKVIEEQASPDQKQRLLDNRASINKVYEEIAGPSKSKELQDAIREAFRGVTLEQIKQRRTEGKCPCCGQVIGKGVEL
jgi:hypothetical protein